MKRRFTLKACALAAVALFFFAAQPAGAAEGAGPVKPAEPKLKIAGVVLTGELAERPAAFSFEQIFHGAAKPTDLAQLTATLNKAAADPGLSGVLFELKGFRLSLAQAQELGAMIGKLRGAGKKVFVYAPDYSPGAYVLAAHADGVLMPEEGNVLFPGAGVGLLFFKGLFDKIGVQADMVQVGKYKGAEEPFTRTDASPEYREQMTKIVDGLYEQMVQALTADRKLEKDKAVAAINQAWFTGKQAKEAGLVDGLVIRENLKGWLDKRFGTEVELAADYGKEAHKGLDLTNPFALFSLLISPPTAGQNNKPAIAVIYADAVIMDDQPEGSGFGGNWVTPARMRKAIRAALDDARVKAIVLRVDSPGGSASASDEIWQMLHEADQAKPVTVSMGRMAASGGYYIACGGRSISADQATLTGSIGVVGGKLVLKQLLDKIGLNLQEIRQGTRAALFSPMQAFDPDERAFVRKQMENTYAVFTDRVKSARGPKIANVDDVAQGRLFTGPDAVQAGLVDRIASLDQTVLSAATAAGIAKDYQVIALPETKGLADILREGLGNAEVSLEMQAALSEMPPPVRQAASQIIALCRSLQQPRVLTVLPGIVER